MIGSGLNNLNCIFLTKDSDYTDTGCPGTIAFQKFCGKPFKDKKGFIKIISIIVLFAQVYIFLYLFDSFSWANGRTEWADMFLGNPWARGVFFSKN